MTQVDLKEPIFFVVKSTVGQWTCSSIEEAKERRRAALDKNANADIIAYYANEPHGFDMELEDN